MLSNVAMPSLQNTILRARNVFPTAQGSSFMNELWLLGLKISRFCFYPALLGGGSWRSRETGTGLCFTHLGLPFRAAPLHQSS